MLEIILLENPPSSTGKQTQITLSFKIGKIRGLACRRCNEAMQEKQLGSIPLYFHNSSGYDSHLLLRHFPPNAEGKLSGKNRTINVT